MKCIESMVAVIAFLLIICVLAVPVKAGIVIEGETHRVWGENNGDVKDGFYDIYYPYDPDVLGSTNVLPIYGECSGQWSDSSTSQASSKAGHFYIEPVRVGQLFIPQVFTMNLFT